MFLYCNHGSDYRTTEKTLARAGERAKVAGERAKRIAAYVLLRQKDRFDMRD
jgi:hypothetical protein